MFKKILVPLDGSEIAEAILPFVQEIAKTTKASIVLCTAVESSGVWDATASVQVLDKEEQAATDYLANKAAVLGPGATARVTRGEAAEAIITVAEDEKADLVAIATHGRSGLARWLFGSTATKLLETSPVPVLFLRPKEGEDKGAPGAVVHKILVPLDGSAEAMSVLPTVEDFAKAMGASLVLFHAVAPIASYPGFETAAIAGVGDVINDLQQQAREILTKTAKEVEARGIECTAAIVVDTATDGILRAADELKVDLIAIGSHGRGGFGRMVLGSTADSVVRRSADVPCLIVRGKPSA
jgi:nucleotide-binding universal stress UspA family protein